jgi:hypothetical protein
VRLSKLEPHVVQPVDDNDDIESFLNEIRAQQSKTEPVSSEVSLRDEGAKSTEDEVKHGFVRLVDFLKAKKKSGPHFSKRDMAIRAYLSLFEEPQPAFDRYG